jgi:hypothetical protein
MMSWQEHTVALCRRLGPAGKSAARVVLDAVLPGSPAVVELVGQALDCVTQTTRDNWAINSDREPSGSSADRDRLGEVMDVLSGDLASLVAQVAALEAMPDAARQVLNTALATDDRVQSALDKLVGLARGFDRLGEQNRRLLESQGFTADVLAELLPLVGRLAGVADFVGEWRAGGLAPADLRGRLAVVQLAEAAFGVGKVRDAERHLQPLAQSDPDSAAVTVALAALQAAGHDLAAARASLGRAARRRPDDTELAELSRRITRAGRLETPTTMDTPRRAERPGVGDVLDGWELEALMGAGGWGQVFRARKGERQGALKVMHPELAGDPGFAERFRREIMTLIRLDPHPSLVRIQEFGCDLDRRCWYLVMDLVEGWSLERFLRERGPLSVSQARSVFTRLAEALAVAHYRGVVHRDVKPANIILRNDGTPVLVDFGIAGQLGGHELTRSGSSANFTLAFASPEQLRGRTAGPRSDVYSLAGAMYYALTYDRPSLRDPENFEPENVPEEIREVLIRALQTRPEKRHADAGAFRQALASVQVWPRMIEVKVPGEVWCRQAATEDARPLEVGQVPGPVRVERGMVYQLAVSPLAGDADLEGLAQLKAFTGLQGVVMWGCHRLTDACLPRLQAVPELRELGIGGSPSSPNLWLSDAGLASLRPLSNLLRLSLYDCARITDAGLESLGHLVALRELFLVGCNQVTGVGLAYLRLPGDIRKLSLVGEGLTDSAMPHLRAFPLLEKLTLSGERLTDSGLAHLQALSSLVSFTLGGRKWLTDAGLPHLRHLQSLRELSLSGCARPSDAGLVHLRPLTALESLDLSRCDWLTGEGLAHLWPLEKLQALNLSECQRLMDDNLAHLRLLTALRSLNLSRCRGLSHESLTYLRGLKDMEVLDLHDCAQLTDAWLVALRPLAKLATLNLGGCTRVTDAGLGQLRSLTALQKLNLSGCRHVTDQGLANLRALTALRDLRLAGCPRVTDAGLAMLRSLTALQALDLEGCYQVSDAGLGHLRSLTALESLYLSNAIKLSDAGLAHLRALTALRELDLSKCSQLSDAGLGQLRGLPALRSLNLSGCERLSAAAVAGLRQALPQCSVHH